MYIILTYRVFISIKMYKSVMTSLALSVVVLVLNVFLCSPSSCVASKIVDFFLTACKTERNGEAEKENKSKCQARPNARC